MLLLRYIMKLRSSSVSTSILNLNIAQWEATWWCNCCQLPQRLRRGFHTIPYTA